MMIVQTDNNMSAPSSWERAKRLYEKNIELENKRRKSAKARVPSDPNAWQQMRENYEAIILEDHAFSEKHNIEYGLWLLHYRRIEELRAHYNAAKGSNTTPQGVKGPPRPDRITKIRLQFKTFLSEASGFYHDLIVKIRAKYGLALDFSGDSENRNAIEKNGKNSIDIKKGLISCHQCLIYLGDLARYKGLYGEDDSKTREFATASSYYLQAASVWPASGNPHHQLAILAAYASDELLAVYRYFRSLAVESPFPTARDNLIFAFEKNRQIYSQLHVDVKAPSVKEAPAGRGRGKEARLPPKDANMELKEVALSTPDTYKSFCIRFVRLNGILFTRISLETFAEVLSLVSSAFRELLSSGPEEQLNFGADPIENGVFIVRLIAILIFTVHNVLKESEGQTYAEIVHRAVLLQNAYNAVFEVMGHILERCLLLRDPSSSYLLPGILVFVEWLACCPDIAAGKDMEEKQATSRSKFWHHCISFWNKLLSIMPMSLDDDGDETCFYNMSRYEEGETENRLALREDLELRGFLPLIPAQTILDFSRKHSFGSDGSKEQRARVKRVLAAGKALANMVKVDKKDIRFDSKLKKFVIGVEPQMSDDFISTYSNKEDAKTMNLGTMQPLMSSYTEVEDDEEEIVFKPIANEKRTDVIGTKQPHYEGYSQSMLTGNLPYGASSSSHPDYLRQYSPFDGAHQAVVSSGNAIPHQHLQPVQPVQPQGSSWLVEEEASLANSLRQAVVSSGNAIPNQHLQPVQPVQPQGSSWLVEEEASLANSLRGLRFMENGHVGISNQSAITAPVQQPVSLSNNGSFYGQTKAVESLRKNPVSRPIRHLGPPPGFNSVPHRPMNEHVNGSNLAADDYSWLDGHQVHPSGKGHGLSSFINYSSHGNLQYGSSSSNGLIPEGTFPFPGKQVPAMPQQHHHQQQLVNGNQQLMNGNHLAQHQEQYQGQPSGWNGGRYIV